MDLKEVIVQKSTETKYTIGISELSKWPIFQSFKELNISRLTIFSAMDISKHGEGLGAFIVTENDNVYGIGLNTDENLLGLAGNDYVETPTKIDNLSGKKIKKIVVGMYQGVALSENGSVFFWNRDTEPTLFEMDSPVADIACGADFFLMLTRDSNVYLSGTLSSVHHLVKKDKILLPDGVQVKSIECGDWHIVIVSTVGEVYSFGDNLHSQLGYESDYFLNGDPYEARRVTLPHPCCKVACGVYSTHYLLGTGEVLANGSNAELQPLGVGHGKYAVHPEKVLVPESAVDLVAVVRFLKSGVRVCSFAVKSVTGKIYVWGTEHENPTVVPGISTLLEAYRGMAIPQAMSMLRLMHSDLEPSKPREKAPSSSNSGTKKCLTVGEMKKLDDPSAPDCSTSDNEPSAPDGKAAGNDSENYCPSEGDGETTETADYLLGNTLFSDFTIKLACRDIPVHKVVLYTKSPFFRHVLKRNRNVEGMDLKLHGPKPVLAFLKHIYEVPIRGNAPLNDAVNFYKFAETLHDSSVYEISKSVLYTSTIHDILETHLRGISHSREILDAILPHNEFP